MEPDFFKSLPPEITSNIFLKLCFRSIAVSKCVCKPWLNLLESDDFVASHFAQSAPALALSMPMRDADHLKLFELEEALDLYLHLDLDPLTRFDFPASIGGSADGLLFLYGVNNDYRLWNEHFYICNPITREYIELVRRRAWASGFGVSRISGQHKAVFVSSTRDGRFQCRFHTLGTGSRSLVEAPGSFKSCLCEVGAFVCGNLHWKLSDDRDGTVTEWICCLDLETERFSGFSMPPLDESHIGGELHTFRDSLAFCHERYEGEGISVWMMEEYGVEDSWTKVYMIDLGLGVWRYQWFRPIKMYENGDLLFHLNNGIFYYSKETQSGREISALFGVGEELGRRFITSHLHTPSILSLKRCFGSVENVVSF